MSEGKKIMRPMQGVKVWKNPKNNFCVVEIHYTADPKKRDPEWKKRMKPSMPIKTWNREYEISWDTWEGTPVFPDFVSLKHCADETLYPDLGLPLLRGWDFGLTPACIIAQLQGQQLVVFKEFVEFNMGIERFTDLVLPQCAQIFRNHPDKERDWIDLIDPAGFQRKDTDERCCADVMRKKGLKPKPGATLWEPRRKSVEHFLTTMYEGQPALLVSEPECPTFVQGMKGGYQYPKKVEEDQKTDPRPLKNKFSHVADAFQMITSTLNSEKKPSRKAPPRPYYGFTRNR